MADELKPDNYNTPCFPTWCPGCGNFGIWAALKAALVKLNLAPHQVILVYGIGCSGNFASFIRGNIFHALHGRTLPAAIGAKLANHEMPVIAMGGDGDGFAEGLAHFLETCRANPDFTYIVHDNHSYSLTTGQTSPTSMPGFKSKTTPDGAFETQLNPVAMAVTAGATFIARGFAGDIPHLTDLIVQAVGHKGFSFVDVMQPCPTFNPELSYDWYRQRVYKLEEKGYQANNRFQAWERAQEAIAEKIGLGVFYKEDRAVLESNYSALAKGPLVGHDLNKTDISPFLEALK
jgi:2-oxoglutarate ferredoxin oxidoreductase subunit beta